MGNYISCTLSNNLGKHSGPKVILPNGEIRKLDGHINAAELMFEVPNHFLVNSRSMEIGRRFSALSADEDLEMGNVYVMFPMKRVNSVISSTDMGGLLVAANSAIRRASGGTARVLPETSQASHESLERVGPNESVGDRWESEVPRLKLDELSDIHVGEFKYRLSMCRSRRPVLETIAEETICSR